MTDEEILRRIGQQFDNEAEFTGDEVRLLVAERKSLRDELADLRRIVRSFDKSGDVTAGRCSLAEAFSALAKAARVLDDRVGQLQSSLKSACDIADGLNRARNPEHWDWSGRINELRKT